MRGTSILPKRRRVCLFLGLLILISACAGNPRTEVESPEFEHDFTGPAVPWTHDNFDNQTDKFTFALFSDLTGGERDGVFAVAIEQLQLLRPELIVNVGDLIDGGTQDLDLLERQWDSFDQRAGLSRAPVFYVGGNHDLTNPDMWKVWEERYGNRYYHFVYKNVLFLALDTEDNPPDFQQYIHEIRLDAIRVQQAEGWAAAANTEYGRLEERKSGRISVQQAAYFRQVIEQHPNVRWTFLLMHKPAWQRPAEENFTTIETALNGRPYTVFYGHVHAYLHELRNGRDYIRLGTTGGSHNPNNPMAIDHVTLVTVSEEGTDIANLRMSGIFDKTGKTPLNGDELCFEVCKAQ